MGVGPGAGWRGGRAGGRLGAVVLATLVAAAPAHAAEAETGGPFDGVLRALQLKGRTAPSAPFVTQSRPAAPQGYIPVHAAPPPGPVRIKTPAEVAATEAELDAVRVRQQRAAGQVPPTVPLKPKGHPKRAAPTLR